MGRRHRKISDLSIPGFDRDVRWAGNLAFKLFGVTGYLIGRSVYNNMKQSGCFGYSHNSARFAYPSYPYNSPKLPKLRPKKSEFKEVIDKLELAIDNKTATVYQYEELADIYSTIGDYFKERYVRLKAIECFLNKHGLGHLYFNIVDAFNHSCKKPPQNISSDKDINVEYRRLLHNAELAKQKSYKY